MTTVRVVTAYVPLQVEHMDSHAYHTLGQHMFNACRGRYHFFDGYPLEKCWSYNMCKDLSPATETPPDRYATPEAHVRSHIVQHTRTQWALEAAALHPDVDVWVWLDLGILKQGKWNDHQVQAQDVTWLLDLIESQPVRDDIPFPGIAGPTDPWLPHGNNWRFCGSTHIWQRKYLEQIHRSYKTNLINFIAQYRTVPLDLAIWPMVECTSGLPFKWYKAEYDNTQLRNYPCAL
jgi:hypothetical protein